MKLGLGDVSVHYEQHGDGVPLLVLHGAGADHREAGAGHALPHEQPEVLRALLAEWIARTGHAPVHR